jgi:hypothetical protein
MSIIQYSGEVGDGAPSAKCNVCGGHLYYPHIQYCYLYICHECAQHNTKGLMLDLVQCRAILEMKKIADRDVTLERTTPADIKKRDIARDKEGRTLAGLGSEHLDNRRK